MLSLKIVGLCFTVASGLFMGLFLSNKLKQRFDTLNWYIKLCEKLSDKIRYSGAEIHKIVSSVSGSERYYTVEFPFLVTLKSNGLKMADELLVKDFFGELGSGDTETEIKRCTIFKKELISKLGIAEKEYKEKGKVYKSLGFLGGLLAAIIFI